MTNSAQNDEQLLVIFDGHCALCNHAVRWFLRRDLDDRMRFAPSEAPVAAEILERLGVDVEGDAKGPGSIVVVRGHGHDRNQALLRTDAVIAMLRELPQPWASWRFFLRLVPRPLRDWGYGVVARWRYRIWGRLEVCPIPTEAEREKFL
ncbi:MAG: DUF393 domain-containing protein [Acidobacteriota bacterium]|nr:DUF393 domain-containing protein [Acidobacteriota bacterium]